MKFFRLSRNLQRFCRYSVCGYASVLAESELALLVSSMEPDSLHMSISRRSGESVSDLRRDAYLFTAAVNWPPATLHRRVALECRCSSSSLSEMLSRSLMFGSKGCGFSTVCTSPSILDALFLRRSLRICSWTARHRASRSARSRSEAALPYF
jgi:hypothetical protein